MADTERILDLRINYGDAIKKIAEYKEAIEQVTQDEKKLNEQLKKGEITQQEYLEQTTALTIEKKQYSDQIRVLNKEVSNEIKMEKEQTGSLKSLRAELSNATKEFDELSRAEREGAKGQELQKHINELTDEIKGAETATQRYYRNVGNYPKEVIAVIKDTTLATGSLKEGLAAGGNAAANMGKQMLKLLANPFVALFAAIAGAVMAVVKAFDNSEERMNRLKVAMTTFEPIVNGVKNALGALADGVMVVIEAITAAAEKILSLGADFLNFIGIQNDYNEQLEKSKQLEKERQDAIEKTRQLMVEESEAELEVARQRDKVAQKDKYTRKERMEALEEAIRIEQEIAEKKKRLAQQNYDNLFIESQMTENDAEMNNKLAEAKRNLNAAETEYLNNTRKLQQQLASFKAEAEKEDEEREKKRKQRAEEAKKAKEAAKAVEEAEKKKLAALQAAEDAMLALVLDTYEKQYTQTQYQYDREIQALRERAEKEIEIREILLQTAAAKEQLKNETLAKMEADHNKQMQEAADKKFFEERDRRAKEIEDKHKKYEEDVAEQERIAKEELAIQQEKAAAIADVMGNLSDIATQFAGNNKALAKLSKILALAEIAINTGKAISAGVAQASAAGPFPANIAAIASVIATIVSGMTSAIASVKSAKFAQGGTVNAYAGGGYVSGPGTGTSDSISARLSNGESVNTALSTQMFGPALSAMNMMAGGNAIQGGSGSNMGEAMLARAFMKGAALLPNPVVSVQEVATTQDRVRAIENLSSI